MNLIKTKSFELAVNTKGNEHSNKIAILLPGRLDTKDYACFDSHIEYLARKGFFAISFDPPPARGIVLVELSYSPLQII